MMMTGCDLSAITKPWEVQSKVGGLHGLRTGLIKEYIAKQRVQGANFR